MSLRIGTPPRLQATMMNNISRCVRIVGLSMGTLSPDPDERRAPSLLNER